MEILRESKEMKNGNEASGMIFLPNLIFFFIISLHCMSGHVVLCVCSYTGNGGRGLTLIQQSSHMCKVTASLKPTNS